MSSRDLFWGIMIAAQIIVAVLLLAAGVKMMVYSFAGLSP